MLLWGGPIYTPLAHFWYNKVLEKYVTSTGVKMVATKVVADQLIFAPLINPLILTVRSYVVHTRKGGVGKHVSHSVVCCLLLLLSRLCA
jgi:hypothetical protein